MNVRCYTCGSCVGDREIDFFAQTRTASPRDVLDRLGILRPCCRIQFLTHVDTSRDLARFSASDTSMDDVGTRLYRMVRHARRVSCTTGLPLEDREKK